MITKSRVVRIVIQFALIALAASPYTLARAHHLLPKNDLQCSKDFPCPDEITRRVDFWIEVFKGWKKEEAIFHDPDVPERVYSVIHTGEGCARSATSKVKKERKRIKSALETLAVKVSKNQVISEKDQHLYQLFPSGAASEIRTAAKSIRCQGGVRDGFLNGLQRFHRYSELVDNVLAQNSLPPDIRYLPFVESSYNPGAYSKAGAAGMWQIMPKTARVLGLELNATIDERLDPEAATRAAAKYLLKARKSLLELARSLDPAIQPEEINPFVITSYNYGVNGMRRAIKKIKPDYMSVLNNYKSGGFQVAVKNFYSSFLAARHVALNSDRYFGSFAHAEKVNTHTLVLKHPTSIDRIKRVFGLTEKQLKPLNLPLTRFVWNGWRFIPNGYRLRLPLRADNWVPQISRLGTLPIEKMAPGAQNYVVKRGDTACGIARALGTNCRQLIKVNHLGKKAVIRVGQKLTIPGKVLVVQTTTPRSGFKKSVSDGSYRVRKGDSACVIAEKFGVKCRTLIAANQLGRKAKIYVGQRLTIPGAVPQSSSVSVLNSENLYVVKSGDSLCIIAQRFSVNCTALKKLNKLKGSATIFPGQKLKVPGYEVPNTTETATALAKLDQTIEAAQSQATPSAQSEDQRSNLQNLLDTLPELGVSVSSLAGQLVYTIRVEADETVGHYADWLGLRASKSIRKLNGLSSGRSLPVGKLIKLPIEKATDTVHFEKKRIEYHQVLSESFKEHYVLYGIEPYKVRRGDSLWLLSHQFGFPLWLLYRVNQSLGHSTLAAGKKIMLPKIQEK